MGRASAPNDATPRHSTDFVGPSVLLLRALANPERLLLLSSLEIKEQCVSELAVTTGIRQPTLSQQLGVLRDQGLVSPRREGKYIFYRLSSATVIEFLNLLRRFARSTVGEA